MLLSGLSFSLMSLLISQLGDRFSSFQLLGLRSSTGSVCCVVWLVAQKVGVLGPREDRGKLLTRALVGTFAMCCNWYVITQLPLAEATCIIFSAPLWTMVSLLPSSVHCSSCM
jgi:drug/metabolite transporter (DMT)-like permease